jgi:hypothetical protein
MFKVMDGKPWRPVHGLVLALCVVLFVAVRARWLGHLVTWDEAMNVCTTRSLASGSEDYYSRYLFRHPPMLNVLWLLLGPLQQGFVARAEWFAIAVNLAGLLAMVFLNAVAWGPRVALFSAACLALMPGSAYFSLWLKQDALVVPFGLAAMYLFLRRRHAWSGVLLGAAFLAKAMALYMALAVGVLWLLRPSAERRFRDLALVGTVTALVAGWWYVFLSPTVEHFLAFATGGEAARRQLELFSHPWHYFLGALTADLSLVGVLAALVGFVAMLAHHRQAPDPIRAWPVALLVPSYMLISLSTGKAPWFVIALYVAWATVQAVGIDAVLRRMEARGVGFRRAAPFVGAAVLAAQGLCLAPLSFEGYMREQESRMWWSAAASREVAQTLNRVVGEDERVLITPMFYNGAIPYPCPIFVVYLKDVPVLVRPNTLDAGQLVEIVRANRLHWAMVSAPPDTAAHDLVLPLARTHGLRPIALRGALLFRTSALWEKPERTQSGSPPLSPTQKP